MDREEEKSGLYSKIVLVLLKPHKERNNAQHSKRTYLENFHAFKETEYCHSQAGRILYDIGQYYSIERKATKLMDASREGDAGVEGTSSGSESEDYSENNAMCSEFEDAKADATNASSRDYQNY